MHKILLSLLAFTFTQIASAKDEVNLNIMLRDSKIIFSHKVDSFNLQIGKTELPCKYRFMYLDLVTDIQKDGWNSDDFNWQDYKKKFVDEYGRGAELTFSSCRNENVEALAWFPGPRRQYESDTTYELLRDEYNPKERPLYLQIRSLKDNKKEYYSCDSRTKEKLGESDKSIKYRLQTNCKSISAPKQKTLGLLDLVNDPGPYAALISYRGGMLPSVPANAESLETVAKNLFKMIPQGTYTGVMKTLSKTCEVEFYTKDDTLFINHTITIGKPRTRRLALKASDLLGYTEGLVYEDPIRIEEQAIGNFASAEFNVEDKNPTLNIRFENNDTKDGMILRINGPETYCRRLVKK